MSGTNSELAAKLQEKLKHLLATDKRAEKAHSLAYTNALDAAAIINFPELQSFRKQILAMALIIQFCTFF